MLSDTEDDLPRLEAEYHDALTKVHQLGYRISRLRNLMEQRYRSEFFQWARSAQTKGGQHGADN